MAKDDIDLDLENFDDLGIEMPSLDDETAEDKDLGSRSPIVKTGKSFLKGLKKTVVSPTALEKVIDGALPESYRELRSKGSEVVGLFGKIKDDLRKEIKPEIKKVKKIINKALPMGEKYLPKGIKDRLEELSKDKEDYSGSSISSKTNADESLLQSSLNNIFSRQEQINQEKDTLEKVEMIYKEKRADLRTKATLSVQNATQSLMSRLVSYQDTVTANYQRQSLELQFRHYFVARDLFAVSQAAYKDINEELKGIKHNTALPEVQKIQLSETWKQGLMQQIWGARGESAAEFANKYWDKAKGNLINKVKEKVQFIKDPVSMVLDGIRDYQDIQESMRDLGESTPISESAGGFAGGILLNRLIKPLRRKLAEKIIIQRGDAAAQYINENPMELLEDFASKSHDNPILNAFSNLLYDILPTRGEEEKIDKRYKTTGLEAIPFDVSTRRSIVEIIPGFLSRIHQGIMSMVTGDKNYSRLVFDSSTESFKSIKELGETAKKNIAGDSIKSNLEYMFDNFYRKLDKDNKLSDKERKLISRRLLEDADKGVKLFDPRNLTNKDWYKQEVDDDTINKIKEVIDANYKFTETGGLDFTDKNLLDSSRWVKGISKVIPNYQELINTYQNFGEMDTLRESGFIGSNEYNEKFLHAKLWDSLLGISTEDTSDEEEDDDSTSDEDSTEQGGRIRLSFKPIKRAINKTNKILTEIKTLNENCCNNDFLEKEFVTRGGEFRNAKEIFLNINQSLTEIKEKEIGGSSSTTTLADNSNPVKVGSFKEDVLDYLEAITAGVWAGVEATSLSGSTTTINVNEDRSKGLIKKSLSRVISGGGTFLKGYGSALKGTGQLLGSTAKSIGSVGKRLGRMDGIKDIYVTGDDEPRLVARKIRKDHYYNQSTNTPVHKIEDITGVVVDVDNDNEVIITEEDCQLGFYTYMADGTIRKAASKALDLTKGMFSGYGFMLKGAYNLTKRGLGVSRQIYREMKGVKDVYVAGENVPRLLGIVMRRGGYLSANKQKPIYSLKDIDGPIIDSTGKVVLALEDLDNLYDKNNKKIDIRSLSEKLLGGIGGGLGFLATKTWGATKWGANKALWLAKMPFQMSWRGMKKVGGAGKNLITKSIESLAKKMGYTPSKKEEVPYDAIIGYESVSILNKIYSLLFRRLPKNKNIRKGSWQEQFMEDKKEDEKEEEMEDQQEMEKKGVMAKLVDKLKMKGHATGGGSGNEGIISKLTDYGLIAGAAGLGSMAWGAATSALGAAGTGLATAYGAGGLAAVGGLISSAVLAPLAIAGGVALAGYGMYKGAKYLLNRKAPEPLEKLRMMQYGVSEDERDRLAILREFEKIMMDKVTITGKMVRLSHSPSDIFKEVYELFDLDPNDKNIVYAWGYWYVNRFKPFFIGNVDFIVNHDIEDFDELEDLTDKQKIIYIKNLTASYLKKCYSINVSPFGDGTLSIEPVEIENYTKELLGSLRAEKEQKVSLKVEDGREVKTNSGKESGEEEKTKDGAEEQKGFFSRMMGNVSEFFSEKKLPWDNRKLGIIEKYRLLQYGVNPNDDYQVQPIRAFEKYCLEEYNYDIEKLTKVSSYFLLQKVIDYFPFELNNKNLVKKWQKWYENRFLPIYAKYIMFMEREKIKDFFDLEKIVTTKKLSALVNLVNVENNEKRSYEILSTPFGNYFSNVSIDLIKEYENYLLSLQKNEKISLGLFSNVKESFKTYAETKNERSKNIEEETQQILSNKNLPTVGKEKSRFEIKPDDKTEDITLIPPVDVKPNSLFGLRKDPFGNSISIHKGVDYAAPEGTPIKAAAEGEMIRKDRSSSYGNVVYLKHKDGLVTKYAHMSGFNDEHSKGDIVKAGDIIGYVGNTGRSSGNHLHFELRKGTNPKDPAYDPISHMENGTLLAANDNLVETDKQVGGPSEPVKEFKVADSSMEDYTEVLTKKDEMLQKKRTKAIEAQRQMENKESLQRLFNIDNTLKESLKIQITMSEYLQLIHKSINSYEMISSDKNEKPKNDETLTLRLPNNESVAPLVSMRRRKTNG